MNRICDVCSGTGRLYDDKETGEQMRSLRESKGVSLRQLAKRLRKSPAYIWKLEVGESQWNNKRIEDYIQALKGAIDEKEIEKTSRK